jgi:hypothetical protein
MNAPVTASVNVILALSTIDTALIVPSIAWWYELTLEAGEVGVCGGALDGPVDAVSLITRTLGLVEVAS